MKANSKTKKSQSMKRLIPACLESNLLSKAKRKKMPSTRGYSGGAKIYDPLSRNI